MRSRYLAAYALGGLGPVARSAQPALEKALVDEDALVRVHATGALARVADGADAYLPRLLLAWRDTYDPEEPYPVLPHWLDAVEALGPAGAPAVPQILQVLDGSPDQYRTAEDRIKAVRVLARMGPSARAALPRLRELAGTDGPLTYSAGEAVKAIAGPTSPPPTASAA